MLTPKRLALTESLAARPGRRMLSVTLFGVSSAFFLVADDVVLKRRSGLPSMHTFNALRALGSVTACLAALERMSSPPSLRRRIDDGIAAGAGLRL